MIPADAELTARPDEIPAWDDMPDDLKPVLARQMEVYAGFMEHTDHHVGRLIDALDDLEILDDTLVYVHRRRQRRLRRGHAQRLLQRADWSSTAPPRSRRPSSWPRASTTSARPRPTTTTRSAGRTRWTRPTSGPSRSPRTGAAPATARSSTGRTASRPRARSARSSTTSSTSPPTVLDAAGLPEPDVRPRRAADAAARRVAWPTRSTTRRPPSGARPSTSRCSCNRGIYHKGWTAVTRHSTPWVMTPSPPLDDDVWELYGPDDWTQAHDLAAEQPEKLAELQRLFLIEATKYNVLPLDDRRVERFNPDLAGRPQLVARQPPDAVRRHGTADRELGRRASRTSRTPSRRRSSVPDGGAEGVIVAQGGAFGGWSLYLKDGRPAYCYNLFGLQQLQGPRRDRRLRPASTRCGWSSPTTAAASARAARRRSTSTAPRSARAASTPPCRCSSPADETTDVGSDSGTPVSDDLGPAREPLHRARALGPDRPRRRRRRTPTT